MIKECECFKDQMTSKERMAAFAAGKEIDRIPCIPLLGEPSTRFIGTTMSRYYHSAELMAQAEIAAFRMFRHDSVGAGPGLHGIPEAMGTELAFPEDGFATVSNPVLKDYKDLDRLSPINPNKDGRLPLYLKALKLIDEQIGDQVSVGSNVGGPFTIAAGLRGTENVLRDLRYNPEMAHRLLKLATESAINYIDAVCDLGFTPGIAEPSASGTMISLKTFREFAKPYLKMYVDRIKERKGIGPSLHICGDTRRIWEDMADTGATVLSLDNQVDLAEAKARVGDRTMGGMEKVIDILTQRGLRDSIKVIVGGGPLSLSFLTGPISLASSLLEPMIFYEELRTKNMAAHEFMAFVTENLIAFGNAMVEAGADVIAIADPSGTGEILGPRMFRDFAVPYLNKLLAGVALVPGGTIVHICGRLRSIYSQLNNINCNAISFDSITSVRQLAGTVQDKAIMGNVSTYALEIAGPEKVRIISNNCLANGVNILSPACGIGPRTPLENIKAMVAAARAYGERCIVNG